ncbi:MAG TPA: VOC family protein [Tepidisphaeraceae bacterium]|nr:VOC family protein [Tepidisphaeraceae bacterium]
MLESIDHVNIVVNDLPRMTQFYTRVLGLRETKRVTISGAWIDQTVGLRDVTAECVYLDLGQGPRIELLKYVHPPALRPGELGTSNTPGLRHIAFRVDDIDAAMARLREASVTFFSGIQDVPPSQVTYAGGVRKRLVYFHDPEGNLLELCEYKPPPGAAAP